MSLHGAVWENCYAEGDLSGKTDGEEKTENMKQETDAEEKTENRWSRWKKILWRPLVKTIFCTGWCPSTIAMVLLNENKTGRVANTTLRQFCNFAKCLAWCKTHRCWWRVPHGNDPVGNGLVMTE